MVMFICLESFVTVFQMSHQKLSLVIFFIIIILPSDRIKMFQKTIFVATKKASKAAY